LAAGSLLAASGLAFLPAPSARADTTYDALARAVGLDTTASNGSFPAGLVVEGIGPESDAHQSSLGVGDANSSFPYLGDSIPTLPGIFGGAVGVPTPPYPLIASTNLGGKPVTTSFPGVTLHAESNPTNTLANATAGEDAAGLTSLARIDQDTDGSVTATADTAANALKVFGVLSLSGYHSHAEVRADGSTGVLTRKSSIDIGQISVPGLSIAIPSSTPGSIPIPIPIPGIPNIPPIQVPPIPLPFGGTTLTSPDIGFEDGSFVISLPVGGTVTKFALPAQAALDALKAAGITMTFQAAQQTEDGIIAPGVTFAMTLPALPDNSYFSGPTPITFSSGLTVAQVDLHPIPETSTDTSGNQSGSDVTPPAVRDPTAPATTTPVDSTVPPTSSGDAGAGQATGGDVGTLTGSVGATTGSTSGSAHPDPQVVAPNSSPQTQLASSTGAALDGVDARDIYLAFVAAAALAAAAATALRLVGVRFLWGS
jgi:hypothetical protein